MNLLVYITLPLTEDPVKFARELVEHQLAAGINILGPASSVYWWQQSIHQAEEMVLIAQVHEENFAQFREAVLALHPYHTPCVVGLEIACGNQQFLQWIRDNSRKEP